MCGISGLNFQMMTGSCSRTFECAVNFLYDLIIFLKIIIETESSAINTILEVF